MPGPESRPVPKVVAPHVAPHCSSTWEDFVDFLIEVFLLFVAVEVDGRMMVAPTCSGTNMVVAPHGSTSENALLDGRMAPVAEPHGYM